jgi:hypothetical protein
MAERGNLPADSRLQLRVITWYAAGPVGHAGSIIPVNDAISAILTSPSSEKIPPD